LVGVFGNFSRGNGISGLVGLGFNVQLVRPGAGAADYEAVNRDSGFVVVRKPTVSPLFSSDTALVRGTILSENGLQAAVSPQWLLAAAAGG
jgi:hypothetical protein